MVSDENKINYLLLYKQDIKKKMDRLVHFHNDQYIIIIGLLANIYSI